MQRSARLHDQPSRRGESGTRRRVVCSRGEVPCHRSHAGRSTRPVWRWPPRCRGDAGKELYTGYALAQGQDTGELRASRPHAQGLRMLLTASTTSCPPLAVYWHFIVCAAFANRCSASSVLESAWAKVPLARFTKPSTGTPARPSRSSKLSLETYQRVNCA